MTAIRNRSSLWFGNPADEGPTKCDHYVNPTLAVDKSGALVPVPDGGIIDETTCSDVCDGAPCGREFLDGSPYVACLIDAGESCHR